MLDRVFGEHDIAAVMNFASFIEVGASVKDPSAFYRNNVGNTLGLLDVMARHGVGRLCAAKTRCVRPFSEIKHQIDVNTQEHIAARELGLNAVARVDLDLDRAIPFEPYTTSRELGSFIIIDRETNGTVGAGVIDYALRRAQNVHWQALDVDQGVRARQKGQLPKRVWLTGLSGSGKSTIANLAEKKLVAMGHHTYLLDGDNVRHGLNRDLGFTETDRIENIRRVGEVAQLMTDAGLIVLVSFIASYRSERRMVRELFAEGEFVEVFVDTPLPEQAEVVLRTTEASAEELAERLVSVILGEG